MPDVHSRNFEASCIIYLWVCTFILLNIFVSLLFILFAIVFVELICYTLPLSRLHFTSLIGMSHSACVFEIHVAT